MPVHKTYLWYVVALLLWPSQAAVAAGAELTPARAGPDGVHGQFIHAISTRDFESALAMLHPNLSREWTLERFTRDWAGITDQAAGDWSPEVTNTFTGMSPQGVYQQATFRLVSDWRSQSSVDLVSMKIDGEPRIVRIHIRVPYRDGPPGAAEDRADAFIAAMRREDYDAAHAMLAAPLRPQYTPPVLARLQPILEPGPQGPRKSHFRLNANTVWYDAVRIDAPGDPMTFLELIMDSTADPVQIVSLSFRGRIGR